MKSNVQAALGFLAIFAVILFAIPAVSHYYGSVLEASAMEKSIPEGCVRLAISRSEDPAAGTRQAMGEEVEKAWVADVVICPGVGGSIGGPDYGGTLFFELKPED